MVCLTEFDSFLSHDNMEQYGTSITISFQVTRKNLFTSRSLLSFATLAAAKCNGNDEKSTETAIFRSCICLWSKIKLSTVVVVGQKL